MEKFSKWFLHTGNSYRKYFIDKLLGDLNNYKNPFHFIYHMYEKVFHKKNNKKKPKKTYPRYFPTQTTEELEFFSRYFLWKDVL